MECLQAGLAYERQGVILLEKKLPTRVKCDAVGSEMFHERLRLLDDEAHCLVPRAHLELSVLANEGVREPVPVASCFPSGSCQPLA